MKKKDSNHKSFIIDDEGAMLLLAAIIERATMDSEIYEDELLRIRAKIKQLRCTPPSKERNQKIEDLEAQYKIVMSKLDVVLKWLKDIREDNHNVWFY